MNSQTITETTGIDPEEKDMKHRNRSNRWLPSFLTGSLAGMVFGALIGAAVMMLWAPRSGEKTRKQLLKQGAQLRDYASDGLDEAVAVAGDKANEFSDGVQNAVGDLQDNARGLFGKSHK